MLVSARTLSHHRNRYIHRSVSSLALFAKSFTTPTKPYKYKYCCSPRIMSCPRRLYSSTPLKLEVAEDNTCTNKRLISFISDIEGDAGYFNRFVKTSRILEFEEMEPNFSPGLDYFPYNKRVVFHPTSTDEDEDDGNNVETNSSDLINEDSSIDMENPIIVIGGDMWDKGGNDLYVMRQVLSLQKRYKSRVHFIMGNRDINKMRVLQELGICADQKGDVNSDLPPHGGVWWFKNTGLKGDPELIRQYFQEENDDSQDCDTADALVPSSPAERLKWMLRKTMGSPNAFEFRRNELQQEKELHASNQASEFANKKQEDMVEIEIDVTDEEVVESYRTSCHPVHGVMGEYLSKAKLCLRIGGAMFMHGSLPITSTVLTTYDERIRSSIGDGPESERINDDTRAESFWTWLFDYAMPFSEKNSSAAVKPVSTDEWIDALNAFAKHQSDVWRQIVTLTEEVNVGNHNGTTHEEFWATVGGYQTAGHDTRGGKEFGSLCQYGMGWLSDKTQNPSVVYNSWLKEGMPRRFYDKDDEALSYQGIVRDFFNVAECDVIITGHQPGELLVKSI